MYEVWYLGKNIPFSWDVELYRDRIQYDIPLRLPQIENSFSYNGGFGEATHTNNIIN